MKKNRNYEELRKLLEEYMDPTYIDFIDRYYEQAQIVYAGMKRETGEDYIYHPISVAYILAELKMDPVTIGCALIHEAISLEKMTFEEIEKMFGNESANIVSSVTKISNLRRTFKIDNPEKLGLTENPDINDKNTFNIPDNATVYTKEGDNKWLYYKDGNNIVRVSTEDPWVKRTAGIPGQGAELLYGDLSKINLEKRFIPPFLFGFDNFEQMGKSNLAAAEIFGPVLYLCPYDKIEEAIDYMNNREKPLSGYLFTRDNKVKEYVRDNTSSGCLDINDTLVHFSSPYLPFGGVGNSGMSAYHGKWGFDNMSHLKPVVDQASFLLSLRYPPYSKSALRLLKAVIPCKYNRRQVIRCLLALILIIIFLVCVLPKFLCKK